MDLVRLAYYPHLPGVREAVRDIGPELDAVLASPLYAGVRSRARQRVLGALGESFENVPILDDRSALLELLSIPVARMLVATIGEKQLTQRYAALEAGLVEERLARDPEPAGIQDSAQALGVALEPTPEGAWRTHISTYLRFAPHQAEWKLVTRAVRAGTVTLTGPEAARLVREALQRRIADDLETERGKVMPDAVKAALAPLLASVAPKLEEAKESWSSGEFGPVQPALFPPCVHEIFEALKRNENVPHHGRFAFATFLHTVGWNSEQILDYLSATPNFDREKSRYQIEHVTGEKSVQAYTPPGCATMQTNGVCPLDKRDGLCARIKHPLSYYRAKLRFAANDAAKAAARSPEPGSTKPATPAVATPPAGGPA